MCVYTPAHTSMYMFAAQSWMLPALQTRKPDHREGEGSRCQRQQVVNLGFTLRAHARQEFTPKTQPQPLAIDLLRFSFAIIVYVSVLAPVPQYAYRVQTVVWNWISPGTFSQFRSLNLCRKPSFPA